MIKLPSGMEPLATDKPSLDLFSSVKVMQHSMRSICYQMVMVRFFSPGIHLMKSNRTEFVSQLRRIHLSRISSKKVCNTHKHCLRAGFRQLQEEMTKKSRGPLKPNIMHPPYSVLKRNQRISWRTLNCVCNNKDNEEVHQEEIRRN